MKFTSFLLALSSGWAPLCLAAEKSTPIYVVLGGFVSCDGSPEGSSLKLKFDRSVGAFAKALQNAEPEALLIRGCFSNALWDGSRFHLKLPQQNVFSTEAISFFSGSENTQIQVNFVAKIVASMIRRQGKQVKNPVFVITGHSHGAWLAYEVAQYLHARGERVASLFTIDPVDAVDCTPAHYLRRVGIPAAGCQRAPEAWRSERALALYHALGGAWRNYYQTDSYFLHSGTIDILERKGKSAHIEGLGGFNPHFTISDHLPIWQEILKLSRESLGAD